MYSTLYACLDHVILLLIFLGAHSVSPKLSAELSRALSSSLVANSVVPVRSYHVRKELFAQVIEILQVSDRARCVVYVEQRKQE